MDRDNETNLPKAQGCGVNDKINRSISSQVPLSAIIVRPEFNARQTYREIDSLAKSIEEHGLEQPLVVYAVGDFDVDCLCDLDEDPELFLQSGFRRKRALDLVARRGDKDPVVAVQVKVYPNHDEAMFAALAVDATSDSLKDYDLAVRLDYLQRRYPKRDLPALAGIGSSRVKKLLGCLRDLDPHVIAAWSKAPTPEMEIPLGRLDSWRKETPSDQRRQLAAYMDGDQPIEEAGEPVRGRGGRLDGKASAPTRSRLREELVRVHDRLEEGGTEVEIAKWAGIAKGLRFAIGEITRVF